MNYDIKDKTMLLTVPQKLLPIQSPKHYGNY